MFCLLINCLIESGDLYMWGWNETGQLGLSVNHDDTDDDRQTATSGKVPCQTFPVPVDFPGDLDVMTVSCGSRHTGAIAGTSSKYHFHFLVFLCVRVFERNNYGLKKGGPARGRLPFTSIFS